MTTANKRLAGRRILVTRPLEQAQSLVDGLRAHGATTVHLPVIEAQPPADDGPLNEAVAGLDRYDWVVFASVHGVRAVGSRRPRWDGVRVAAVGPATAKELARFGARVDLVPEDFSAVGLLEALGRRGVKGAKVLLPQAKGGLSTLSEGLRALGAQVTRVDAYETHLVSIDGDTVRRLWERPLDAITFTSPSTVYGLDQALRAGGVEEGRRVPVFCIGETTADAACRYGFEVAGIARPIGVDGLVKAVVRYFSEA